MKDRIRQLMESQHMTQQNFSEYIGISSPTLSNLFNGRTQPTMNHVNAIKKRFPSINLDWLMFGLGPMFLVNHSGEDQGSEAVAHTSNEPLLDFDHPSPTPQNVFSESRNSLGVQSTPVRMDKMDVKYVDKISRKITEIRVFYDDQTWESFVPKK